MWETPEALLRMRTRPFLVLLILYTWQGAESGAFINEVRMNLEPRSNVGRGEDVSVICDAQVSYTSQGTFSHNVTFFKDDQVVDTQETQNTRASYVIRGARVSHSGRYRCRVQAEDREKDSSVERLTVKGLQTPTLTVSTNSIQEDREVTAVCRAHDEPGPSFTFYFYENDKEIKSSRSDKSVVSAELGFSSTGPGRKSLKCQYSVQLPDDTVKSEKSDIVTIEVRALSIKPIISVWPETGIVEGDQLEVNCSVSEGNSLSPMHLIKDGWHTEGNTINHKRTVKLQDSGLYICKLHIGNVQKNDSANVSVTELFSEPEFRMAPPEVFEGELFNFSCSSKNVMKSRISERDVTYTFYKDGQPFAVDGAMMAGRSLDGNYSCRADAKGISKSSRHFILKAKELVSPPTLEVIDKVVLGKTFQIRCHSETGYLPINYTLMKGQQLIGNRTVSRPSGYAVFNVSIGNERDVGEFSCRAKNQGSQADSSKRFKVIVPPTKITISLRDTSVVHIESNDIEEGNIEEGDTLTIHCSIQKGTYPITFTWSHLKNHTVHTLQTERVNKSTSVYEVERAGKKHEGGYRCEATNESDMPAKSQFLLIQVKMARWMKLLIGFLCLLVLAVIIGGIWCRLKRGKRKVVKELSVKPSSVAPDDSVTVRLTHHEDVYYSHQVDAGVVESSVWCRSSSHSGSEVSTEENSSEVEYTEVMHPQPANVAQAPCRKGTDTVYSELQNSCQGAECSIDGQGAVEYIHLNHDEAQIVQ